MARIIERRRHGLDIGVPRIHHVPLLSGALHSYTIYFITRFSTCLHTILKLNIGTDATEVLVGVISIVALQ